MKKSVVGDPIQWPGLVFAPLTRGGLVFALGTVANSLGLLFEEFSDDGSTAVCRRKTAYGWEQIRVAIEVRSSSYEDAGEPVDLIICWIDDLPQSIKIPRLAVTNISAKGGNAASPASGLETILPETVVQDLLDRGRNHESYEATIRLLDEQIKKLQNG